MFDIPLFRQQFTEFADTAKYSNAMITLWSTLATAQTNVNRWGTQAPLGISLYVAHQLTLAAMNEAAAISKGTPGGASGPANSKTVGSVTVAYDTQQVAELSGGWWNLTTYGKQYLRLARIFGAGVVQI